MTPFILGVTCLLGSERLPGYINHNQQIVLHVEHLLKTSPAGSWTTFEASRGDGKLVEAEDKLDPELGIGPEEIVGASILTMFTHDAHTRQIFADYAFRWARGWINVCRQVCFRANIRSYREIQGTPTLPGWESYQRNEKPVKRIWHGSGYSATLVLSAWLLLQLI